MPNVAKKHARHDEQQIAEDALRTHGAQRLAADHGKADNDQERADNPPRRQRLLQHQAGEDAGRPAPRRMAG